MKVAYTTNISTFQFFRFHNGECSVHFDQYPTKVLQLVAMKRFHADRLLLALADTVYIFRYGLCSHRKFEMNAFRKPT